MIYIVLNVILAIACVLLSVYVDTRTGNQADSPIIPIFLVLASVSGLMAFSTIISSVAPERLMLFIGRLYLLDQMIFFLMLSNYFFNFPRYETPLACKIIFGICVLFAIYILFAKINYFSINKYCGVYVESEAVFSGKLGELFKISWYQAFNGIFNILIPTQAALMMLVRSETIASKIERQKMYLNAACVGIRMLNMPLKA